MRHDNFSFLTVRASKLAPAGAAAPTAPHAPDPVGANCERAGSQQKKLSCLVEGRSSFVRFSRHLVVPAALFLCALAPSARTQGLCDAAKTATEMITCLTGLQKTEDTLLTRVEAKIRKKLGPGGAKDFDAAAKQWRAYRKAECLAMAGSYAGGKIAPIESLLCQIELTRTRRMNLPGFYELGT